MYRTCHGMGAWYISQFDVFLLWIIDMYRSYDRADNWVFWLRMPSNFTTRWLVDQVWSSWLWRWSGEVLQPHFRQPLAPPERPECGFRQGHSHNVVLLGCLQCNWPRIIVHPHLQLIAAIHNFGAIRGLKGERLIRHTLGILRSFMFACSSVFWPFLELHLEQAVTWTIQKKHKHTTYKNSKLFSLI